MALLLQSYDEVMTRSYSADSEKSRSYNTNLTAHLRFQLFLFTSVCLPKNRKVLPQVCIQPVSSLYLGPQCVLCATDAPPKPTSKRAKSNTTKTTVRRKKKGSLSSVLSKMSVELIFEVYEQSSSVSRVLALTFSR